MHMHIIARLSPAHGAPRDGAPEGRLRLVGDAHAGVSRLLTEPGDTRLLGHADFVLAARPGGTVMTYHGDALILGPLARLDSRFAESLAGSLIAQGLRSLNRRLSTSDVAVPLGSRPSTEASE